MLVNERAVFECARALMRRRYGNDQDATSFHLVGGLPLVQSQQVDQLRGTRLGCVGEDGRVDRRDAEPSRSHMARRSQCSRSRSSKRGSECRNPKKE